LPVFLFISHYHLDHVAGLHALVKFRFRHPLRICGQPGIEATLRSLVREPFTVPFRTCPTRSGSSGWRRGPTRSPSRSSAGRWSTRPPVSGTRSRSRGRRSRSAQTPARVRTRCGSHGTRTS
jgi:ribonuclease BN (tRNA processing enzyme)